MSRVTPSSGRDYSSLREGDWYVATLTRITACDDLDPKEKAFGDATRFDFTIDGAPEAGDFRVWGQHSINNRPGGGPTKLRSILNSLLGETTGRVIASFEDSRGNHVVEYPNEAPRRIEVGMKLEARVETIEKDGHTNVRLEAFRPATAASREPIHDARTARQPERVSADAVPF